MPIINSIKLRTTNDIPAALVIARDIRLLSLPQLDYDGISRRRPL